MFLEHYREAEAKIIGRSRELRTALAALESGKHLLLEGSPGTSKSTLLRAITRSCGIPIWAVEGNADLTPSKLVGYFNPGHVMAEGYRPEWFEKGPLALAMEGGLLYIEEFNRMPADTTNVLLAAIAEGEIHIPRFGHLKANPLFRLVCAQNPYDDVGTMRVSRALYDRLCRLRLAYQSEEEEREIVSRQVAGCSSTLLNLAVRLVRETRRHPDIKQGASVRGAIDLALMVGEMERIGASPREAMEEAALCALTGKIWLKEICERSPEDIVREILRRPSPMPTRPGGQDEEPIEDCRPCDDIRPAAEQVTQPENPQPNQPLESRPSDTDGHWQQRPLEEHLPGPDDALGDPGLLASLQDRLRDEADPESRDIALRCASRIIVRLANQSTQREARRSGPLAPGRDPRLTSDEVEIEWTSESIVDNPTGPLEENLVVLQRQREKLACVLLVDHSYSMKGSKLTMAALAAATLAACLHDGYGVVAFNLQAKVLKPLIASRSPGQVVDDLLRLEARNFTNVREALKLGLKELRGSRKRVGILVGDGDWTCGGDPLELAGAFDQLHVLAISENGMERPSSKIMALVKKGKGTLAMARTINDIPAAIMACLRC